MNSSFSSHPGSKKGQPIMVQIRQETERSRGPDVVIDCPACAERDVPAMTYDEHIRESVAGLIPVNNVHQTWVACSRCKATIRSRLPAADLGGKTPVELADLIYLDASFFQKCLAIIALVVAIFPIVGTVVAAIALFANRKFPIWSKTVSIVALGLSFIPFVLFAGGFVLAMLGVIK
jgi:hypothetical protein